MHGVHKVCVQYKILLTLLVYMTKIICKNKNKKMLTIFIVNNIKITQGYIHTPSSGIGTYTKIEHE